MFFLFVCFLAMFKVMESRGELEVLRPPNTENILWQRVQGTLILAPIRPELNLCQWSSDFNWVGD